MRFERCYVGGNVVENAGGSTVVKYDVSGRYVVRFDVPTPTGKQLKLGDKLAKDAAEYNLLGLMISSAETPGIFTKNILKLMPIPKAPVDLLVSSPPRRKLESRRRS